jgi:hypothetical protein
MTCPAKHYTASFQVDVRFNLGVLVKILLLMSIIELRLGRLTVVAIGLVVVNVDSVGEEDLIHLEQCLLIIDKEVYKVASVFHREIIYFNPVLC